MKFSCGNVDWRVCAGWCSALAKSECAQVEKWARLARLQVISSCGSLRVAMYIIYIRICAAARTLMLLHATDCIHIYTCAIDAFFAKRLAQFSRSLRYFEAPIAAQRPQDVARESSSTSDRYRLSFSSPPVSLLVAKTHCTHPHPRRSAESATHLARSNLLLIFVGEKRFCRSPRNSIGPFEELQ